MTPYQLQALHLQQSMRRLLRRLLRRLRHAAEVRRHTAALQHHQDQIGQLREHYAAIESAQRWHARQAAVATANLRALGAIQPDGSIRNAAAPSWACQRIGGIAVLISAGIVAAAVWHLAAWWLQ